MPIPAGGFCHPARTGVCSGQTGSEGKPARTDNRGQWTIKHADVGPEFQTLVRMAAERQGMTVGGFVVEILRERATALLKGDGEGTPQRGTPPARIEDV